MFTYVIRRLLLMGITMIGITMVIFLTVSLAPGKRFETGGAEQPGMLAIEKQRLERAAREFYGLDDPIHVRYAKWLWKTVRLDFGESWSLYRGQRVLDLIGQRLPPTVQLNLLSMLVVYLIAIPLGTMQALNRSNWADYASTVLTFALYSIPAYVAGTLIVSYLCNDATLNIFPLGLGEAENRSLPFFPFLAQRLWRLLPGVLCLSYGGFAYLSKMQRGALLENLRADYVRTAYAKGLSNGRVVVAHAIRNSLLPIITMAAGILPGMLGGSIVVEWIFDIKGMGTLTLEAIRANDEPIILAFLTIVSFLLLVSLLIVDLLYAKVDPRIRYR